ncbi:MAG TPA: methyltransferase [Devosiaceae bacterium]|jgi:protein-S-isoprenylcysteine O-methyltransferase Ste14|nr:methyltransferase [Devosiaceae bacterium]
MAVEPSAAPKPPPVILLPPPVLAIILAALGWAVALWLGLPMVSWLALWPLGVLLIVAGLALAIWGVATFRIAGTQLAPHAATHRALVVEGPFRYSRNPIYLGLLLILVGLPLTAGNALQLLAPIIFFFAIDRLYIPYEESTMARQFGAEYEAYRQRVRRWL